jgi:hypothetical protein
MAVGFPTKANWAAGDVLTASAMDDLAGTVNTTQYMKPWNQVLNSNLSVWQRGISFSFNASVGYFADRWYAYCVPAGTFTRQATNDTTNLPNIQYCMRIQRNAGNTSTGNIAISQSFETVNSIPYAGKPVTFSFYARAGANYSSTSNVLIAQVVTGTGTDQNGQSGYTSASYPISSNVTLTTTWQRFTISGTISASATEMGVFFSFNPTGTAGANDYFEITGVQLEQGSAANTYQPNQPTYATELMACQKYLPALKGSYSPMNGFATSTTTSFAWFTFPVTPRVAPTGITVSSVSDFQLINSAIAAGTPTAIAFDSYNNGLNAAGLTVTTTAGSPTLVQGQGTYMRCVSATGSILFTGCEL